jgi:hypothetical protein
VPVPDETDEGDDDQAGSKGGDAMIMVFVVGECRTTRRIDQDRDDDSGSRPASAATA